MNEANKTETPKKLGDWELVTVYTGIIITVPMLALLGSAIFAAFADRPGAYVGILLAIIIMLVFWAIIWGGVWIIYRFRTDKVAQSNAVSKLDELERENERLRKLVTELSQGKQLENDSK